MKTPRKSHLQQPREQRNSKTQKSNKKMFLKIKNGAKEQRVMLRSTSLLAISSKQNSNANFSLREAEAEKKAEAARKKAEKDAILAAEEQEARVVPKSSKAAPKKAFAKPLDLAQLDDSEDPTSKTAPALAATGIDNALDALSLTAQDGTKIDKHPERRFKAAFAAYQERRLKEMEEDGTGQGLRKNQKEANIRKEFEKSDENPFNQVNARYDASKEEVKELKAAEQSKIENRLAA